MYSYMLPPDCHIKIFEHVRIVHLARHLARDMVLKKEQLELCTRDSRETQT